MSAALACHDTLVRQAIEASGCVVLKTVGGAFYSVLSDALNGFQAALTAQYALQVEA